MYNPPPDPSSANYCMVCGHIPENARSYPAYYGPNSSQRMQLCKLHTFLFSRFWNSYPPSQRTLSTIRRFIEYEKTREQYIRRLEHGS